MLAVLSAVPTALVARARRRPVVAPTLFAVSVVGVLAVTLLPGGTGEAMDGYCDTGIPAHLFTSSSALLNIALFVPAPLLAVLTFRRPMTVAAISVLCSGAIELIQATASLGRACSVTDITANTLGALIGSGVGTVWVFLDNRGSVGLKKDLVWGISVAAAGASTLVGLFTISVSSIDVVAADDRQRTQIQTLSGASDWIEQAAKEIFGRGTEVEETRTQSNGGRWHVTTTTNRGELSGWWPDKLLERASSKQNRGDIGNLTQSQIGEVGGQFAKRWFPQSVTKSRQTMYAVGNGKDKVYVVLYRRYVNDVMMPMRLDITVTSAGRIMDFASRPDPDPELPAVTIGQEKAKQLAKHVTGHQPKHANLLAQKVSGRWRPVWLMDTGKGDNPDIFLDAVAGSEVTPDL
ncbi:VanZ family protein [Streptomyces melanogenes]|uniref:VanZ family protein n=1 Tax=Streptomyces melanogenes TaxID=67326 RepID=A0ABZ1XMX0_9ACTN|nr:VanZ family protein [Streptomyces melanogenes]